MFFLLQVRWMILIFLGWNFVWLHFLWRQCKTNTFKFNMFEYNYFLKVLYLPIHFSFMLHTEILPLSPLKIPSSKFETNCSAFHFHGKGRSFKIIYKQALIFLVQEKYFHQISNYISIYVKEKVRKRLDCFSSLLMSGFFQESTFKFG